MTTRTAVVTGSSSGIGHATAEHLASRGWRVWGGVRADADLQRIAKTRSFRPLRMDVTKDWQIAEAFAEVKREIWGTGLDLLVVNAGVVVAGPLEFVTPKQWREQFDVNVVGVASTIQAALPMMRYANDPRIIVVGSINSRVGVPLLGPYAASKHALVGLLSALRRELPSEGPKITLLEPGAVDTPLWNKVRAASEQLNNDGPKEEQSPYADLINAARGRLAKTTRRGISPCKVAEIIERCVNRTHPPKRRLVGRDAWLAAAAEKLFGGRVLDSLFRKIRA